MAKYADKLKDPRWQKKRLEIFNRDGFRCQLCDDDATTLAVHHKRYTSGKDPWDYENNLLITLCEKCHGKIHPEKNTTSGSASVTKPYTDTNIDPYTGCPWFTDSNLKSFFKQYLAKIKNTKPALYESYSSSTVYINPDSFDKVFHIEVEYPEDQDQIDRDGISLKRSLQDFFNDTGYYSICVLNPGIKKPVKENPKPKYRHLSAHYLRFARKLSIEKQI